jgi:hypothetical protein
MFAFCFILTLIAAYLVFKFGTGKGLKYDYVNGYKRERLLNPDLSFIVNSTDASFVSF